MLTETKPGVEEMNKAIHEFVGGEWAVVRFTEGGHWEKIEWQLKSISYNELCRLCHTESQIRKKLYHVAPNLKDYEFNYHNSWDALMPVVEKIGKLRVKSTALYNSDMMFKVEIVNGYTQIEGTGERIFRNSSAEGSMLAATHRAVYDFIVWYNNQKQ